jgi:hypothetical protein
MTTIQENSDELGPVHDFAWHRTHRARRSGQLIDVGNVRGMGRIGGAGLTQRKRSHVGTSRLLELGTSQACGQTLGRPICTAARF